jgi:iron complex outermembrane receptor protein
MLGSISTLAISSTALAQEEGALMEEIEVTGIRGALKQAMDTKRFSNASVDAISSEDIGKFPDKNVAESLQRIPGVQVAKGLTGQGQKVSIRGADPELTLTTLNGQAVASTDWFVLNAAQRSFNFDLMPSEMVSGLEVYKSPMAKLDEGGIGGLVNMTTRKPLEMDSLTVYASAEYRYADLSEQDGAAFSGMVSWKNDADTFGILGAFSVSDEVSARTTGENYWGWGAGNAFFDQDRERTSYDITAQFAPTDALDMSLHYFNSTLQGDNTNHNLLVIPQDGVRGTVAGTPGVRNSPNGSPLAGNISRNGLTTDPVTGDVLTDGTNLMLLDSNSREVEITTDVIDLEGTYEGNGFTIHAQLGQSTSEGGTDKEYGTWWVVQGADDIDFDFSGDSVGFNNAIGSVTPSNMMSANQSIGATPREAEQMYFQVDFNQEIELGAFTSYDVGFKYKEGSFEKDRIVSSFATPLPSVSLAQFSDGMSGSMNPEGGSSLSVDKFPISDMPAYSKVLEAAATFRQDRSGYGEVNEDITALYFQGNFEGENYRGNIGLRYVETDASNKGYDATLQDIQKGSYEYSNWLPSMNFAFDLTDDIILRASASKVMSRASYSDLDPSYGGQNPTLQTASQGNIELDPFLANQYDVGVEWYFTEASLMSATVFSKDISSFITSKAETQFVPDASNPGNWTVTKPANGDSGKIEGVELQYQHDLGNGFGWVANYTYSDGEGQQDGESVDLPGNSLNSYNLTGYYENDLFSVRAAWTERDGYLARGLSLGNQSYVESTSGLDASLVVHATDWLDISLEGVNLTNEVVYERQPQGDISVHSEAGARYYLGAKLRF